MEGDREGDSGGEAVDRGGGRRGDEAAGARRRTRARGAARDRGARAEVAPAAEGPERREKRDRRDSRGDGRGRSIAFCWRTFPDVFALRGGAGLARGSAGEFGVVDRRREGN